MPILKNNEILDDEIIIIENKNESNMSVFSRISSIAFTTNIIMWIYYLFTAWSAAIVVVLLWIPIFLWALVFSFIFFLLLKKCKKHVSLMNKLNINLITNIVSILSVIIFNISLFETNIPIFELLINFLFLLWIIVLLIFLYKIIINLIKKNSDKINDLNDYLIINNTTYKNIWIATLLLQLTPSVWSTYLNIIMGSIYGLNLIWLIVLFPLIYICIYLPIKSLTSNKIENYHIYTLINILLIIIFIILNLLLWFSTDFASFI